LDAVGRECLSKKYNISVEIKQQTSKSMYLCSSPFSPSARTSYLLSPPRRYPPPPAPMPLAAPVPACHYSAIAPSPAVRPLARGEWPYAHPFLSSSPATRVSPATPLPPGAHRVSHLPLPQPRHAPTPFLPPPPALHPAPHLILFTYSLFLLRCSPCPRLPQIPRRCRRWHRSGLREDNHRSL
jgi:hypothetical protein